VRRSVDEAYARYRMVAEGERSRVCPALARVRVVDAAVCHFILAVMTTAGMYEASGDWLHDVGVPGA